MRSINIIMNLFFAFVLFTSATLFAQEKDVATNTMHSKMQHDPQMKCCNMKDSTMEHKTHDMCKMNDTTKHHMMQEKTKDSSVHHKMHDMKMMNDSTHQMMMKEKKSPLIREGIIDLEVIDLNKDGKVFQDQMDWNVISDKAGECPLCGMKLKEVSLDKAKENLVKHGYKVK